MSKFNKLEDLDLAGKNVLVRVDLNVPVNDGVVGDTTRIERILPTLQLIANAGGKAILLSHFGRPGGKVDPNLSLRIVLEALGRLTGKEIQFVATDWNDISGAKAAIDRAAPEAIVLLENTRFHPGEESNDPELAARMAELGDLYVNDAFSTAHRAHASTVGLAHLLPNAAGRVMQAELEALEEGLGSPKRPVIALVGGAKVSSKIDLLENLIDKVDALVIGGGMANTFLHASGFGIGKSLCEKDLAETARHVAEKARQARCAIILPIDAVVAWHFEADAPHRLYGIDAVDPDGLILDIGPASIERINAAIDDASTLIWNGPLGVFEMSPFDKGTNAVARYAAKRTREGKLTSVAGGGDTVAALTHAGVRDDFSYVSTAGGAFLEWMEGKVLPGVAALEATRSG